MFSNFQSIFIYRFFCFFWPVISIYKYIYILIIIISIIVIIIIREEIIPSNFFIYVDYYDDMMK